jgi:glycosyltransferase involved in cell wall biosynthesis
MPNFIVMAALLPKLLGVKVILDVHDLMPEAYATKYALSLNHPLIRLLCYEERFSSALADHVITVHDLAKESLIEHGIPADKISIIMNLGNESIFKPQNPRRDQAGLLLAYHGTVAERLGVDLILDALRQCRTRCPGIQFLLIGNGDYMPAVIALIKQYGLEDIIQVKDWVPVEELPDYLSDVDVGVVGMRKSYETYRNWALPVKMLEYAAMEIPTIAPSLRVITHYFDKDSVYYYTPDDAVDMARCIVNVYQHPEKIEAAKPHLRNFNRQYNWGVMESRYLKLIDDLQGSRRNPKPI